MALRHRDLTATVINQENATVKIAGKAQPPKQGAARRPAFNELSNKLHAPPIRAALKRTESLVEHPKPAPKEALARALSKSSAAYSSKQLENVIDPDADSKDEPQMVAEYVTDIFEYLRDMEAQYPVRESFLEGHKSTARMRAILVNWLVQVHSNFKLYMETLHMCVSLVDRYLQEKLDVGRESLQLVGASALLIACKYEEMYMPDVSDFVYVCDDSFSKRQILRMELDILNVLGCNLGKPLSIHFLRRYSKVAQVKSEHHTLAKYMLELALLEYSLCHVKPSILAAAACCLSVAICNDVTCPSKVWSPTLVHYTTYRYLDFKPIVTSLAHLIAKADVSKQQAVRSKYASAAYGKVSLDAKLKGRLVRKLTSETPTVNK